MSGQLSTEQVLILNNFMYMQNDSPLSSITDSSFQNMTLGEIVNKITSSGSFDADHNYGSYMNGTDWQNLCNAVQHDPQLANVKLVSTHVDTADGGGGGVSALFVDPSTNEAIVTFRGTASHEWKDDFLGATNTSMPDGVSTPQQANALDWYKSLDLSKYDNITVTGHSKGGNKAQYITIMDPTVDRCLSFDGQGFSDEFLAKYGNEIAMRQDKITNHAAESDFVNILLNKIGTTQYYKGYDVGGFQENHCPNTFLRFNSDGTVSMDPCAQSQAMNELDQFLNSYLRSMPQSERAKAAEMVGELVESFFNGEDANGLIDMLLSGDNPEIAAGFLAYLIRYGEQHPEFKDAINDILRQVGLEDWTNIPDMITGFTSWKYSDELLALLAKGLDHVPGWLWKYLHDWILEKWGLDLSLNDLKQFARLLMQVSEDMNTVDVRKNGADRKVSPSSGASSGGMPHSFSVSLSSLENDSSMLDTMGKELERLSEEISQLAVQLETSISTIGIKTRLMVQSVNVKQEAEKAKTLAKNLRYIKKLYSQTESKIISSVP